MAPSPCHRSPEIASFVVEPWRSRECRYQQPLETRFRQNPILYSIAGGSLDRFSQSPLPTHTIILLLVLSPDLNLPSFLASSIVSLLGLKMAPHYASFLDHGPAQYLSIPPPASLFHRLPTTRTSPSSSSRMRRCRRHPRSSHPRKTFHQRIHRNMTGSEGTAKKCILI